MKNDILRLIWDSNEKDSWANHLISIDISARVNELIMYGKLNGFYTLTRELVAKKFRLSCIGAVYIGGHHVALHNQEGDRVCILVSSLPDWK